LGVNAVDGVGRNSNRLPHDFGENTSMGAMSQEGITCIIDNFYSWKRQVTLVLPIK
jgi:hypothetical protein